MALFLKKKSQLKAIRCRVILQFLNSMLSHLNLALCTTVINYLSHPILLAMLRSRGTVSAYPIDNAPMCN